MKQWEDTIVSLLDKLFGIKKKKSLAENKPPVKPVPPINTEKKPEYDFSMSGLSQWVTFGQNRDGEVADVVLNKPEENLHRVIVNHSGRFENFPGIIQGDWTNCIEGKFNFNAGQIDFRTSFEVREGGGWRCLWEIQPDGRYWADSDGFGMEDDSEIILFADLDENGNFITPFRIYKIDGTHVNDDPSVTAMEVDAECTLKNYTGSDEVVIVPEGIKKIGTLAFESNKTVKEIQLPSTLTEIGNGAFERSSLERIVIPAGVGKMGYSVFYACESLQSVILPDDLVEINSSTFGFCESLKTIVLPRELKTVNREAFENSGIEEITLPEGMVSVGKDSFTRMHNLRALHIPSSLQYIGENAFSFCEKLEEVILPEGLLQIRHDAFDACSRLKKVEIPNSLIELAPTAFSRTPFSKIEDVKALASRINESKDYPLQTGYKEMTFNGLKLHYLSEEIDFENMGNRGKCQFEKMKLEYKRDISDNISIYENTEGLKAIRLFQSIPTFDSGDREWDSYRKLFLVPTTDGIAGFMVAGGYNIAWIHYYPDIRWGNEKTKKMMEHTGVF